MTQEKDELTAAIEYNHRVGNPNYARVLEHIQGRLLALETRQPFQGVAWLIECGTPPSYYCGEGDWCSNANHALKFPTEKAARLRAMGMNTMEAVNVVEHAWGSSP